MCFVDKNGRPGTAGLTGRDTASQRVQQGFLAVRVAPMGFELLEDPAQQCGQLGGLGLDQSVLRITADRRRQDPREHGLPGSRVSHDDAHARERLQSEQEPVDKIRLGRR